MASKRLLPLLMIIAVWLAAASVASAQTVHTVQPGDSVFRIALQYGTSVQAIALANNLANPNIIFVGQELIIPGGGAAASGTTSVSPPPAASAPAAPTTGTTTTQPAGTYVVQPGDSLYRIALNHGVTVAEIASANNIVNQSLIFVGQQLVIPGGATSSAAPAPAPAVNPAPASPPAAPQSAPVASGNLLPNPSFEGDWYFHLYNELQIPVGWQAVTDEGPVSVTDDPDDRFFRPEIRVVSTAALPPNEHALFIFDGFKTVKAFKGGAPTSFAMFTDVPLQPGRYRFTYSFFPDIVAQYYPGGSRDYSTHPQAAESRVIHNGGGTDYSPATAGQKATRSYEFVVSQAENVRIGAAFRSRFPAANNGYFLDAWSLERIGD